jgi:hypothetical protein
MTQVAIPELFTEVVHESGIDPAPGAWSRTSPVVTGDPAFVVTVALNWTTAAAIDPLSVAGSGVAAILVTVGVTVARGAATVSVTMRGGEPELVSP